MTSGVLDAQDEGSKLGVEVITGAEISSRYHDVTIHILGYGFDIENAELQKLLLHLRTFRRDNMIARMKEIAPALLDEFIEEQGEYFCPPKTAKFLTDRKLAADHQAAWAMIKGVHVAARDVQPKHAITAIHDAGGIAVLAHPFGPMIGISSISKDREQQRKLIAELKDQGLDGLECYQLSHLEKNVTQAVQIAENLELLITGGSDWHGPLSTKTANIIDIVPNYKERFGDFSIPAKEGQAIITELSARLAARKQP